MRTERDDLGSMDLSDDTRFGLETARAVKNFGSIGGPTHPDLIRSLLLVKKAAAETYRELKISPWPSLRVIDPEEGSCIWSAIIDAACELMDLLEKKTISELSDDFPVGALSGGAGTSLNMNINEVICNLALEKLGHPHGDYTYIHPLDTVNKGQSTNDVFPTALRIAAILKLRILSDNCAALMTSLQEKETDFRFIRKLGRTEMMDAMEITLGDEFGAWAQAIGRDRWRLYKMEERLRQINIGGTAVGCGTNAEKRYIYQMTERLQRETGIGLARAEYPMDTTQNQDVFVEVSGLLKSLSVNLMKISGDLRLMGSGPQGGLGEITLPALQKGSTIMPGKVNPVIPEMVTQASIRVIGYDTEITMAASSGNLELNAFLPLIADSLLKSLDLMIQSTEKLRTHCIEGIVPDESQCRKLLERSKVDQYTKLVPEKGYENAKK